MREYVTVTDTDQIVYTGDSLEKACQQAIESAPARVLGHGSQWAEQLGWVRKIRVGDNDLFEIGPNSSPEASFHFRALLP